MTAQFLLDLFDPLGIGIRGIVSRGAQLIQANGKRRRHDDVKWQTTQVEADNVLRWRYLTVEEIEMHLGGDATYGLAPAEITGFAIIDIDSKKPETDEIALRRFERLLLAFDSIGIEPVASTSPSGGYYLYLTTEAPVPRAVLGTWLRGFTDNALGQELRGGVDLYPSPAGGDAAVRLPCGRGYSKRTGELVECRLLGPCRRPLTPSRADDIEKFRDLIDHAVLPLETIIEDATALGYLRNDAGRWYLPPDAPIVVHARERAATTLRENEKPAYQGAKRSRCLTVSPKREGSGPLSHEDLVGPNWKSGIKRISAGEVIGGSEGLYKTVRQLAFTWYVAEARSSDETVAQCERWAETHGHEVRDIRGMARRAMEEFNRRCEGGELKRGLKKTLALFGIDERPRRIVPRLLREDEVIETIIADVERQRLRPTAREILEHLRRHGTISQSTIDEIEGAGARITVRAEENGDVALQRAGDPNKKIRARIGVTARAALMRAGVLRRLANHSAFAENRRSAVYGIDYEALRALRLELGLGPIVEKEGDEYRLIDCPNDVIDIVAEPGDIVTTDDGDQCLHPRVLARELLRDGIYAHLVERVVPELRSEVKELLNEIDKRGTVCLDEVPPEIVEADLPYLRLLPKEKFGLDFQRVRELRHELGLPDPQIMWDGIRVDADDIIGADTEPQRLCQDQGPALLPASTRPKWVKPKMQKRNDDSGTESIAA